jgi:hypothetical protein
VSGRRARRERKNDPLVARINGRDVVTIGDRSYVSGLEVVESISAGGAEGLVVLPPADFSPEVARGLLTAEALAELDAQRPTSVLMPLPSEELADGTYLHRGIGYRAEEEPSDDSAQMIIGVEFKRELDMVKHLTELGYAPKTSEAIETGQALLNSMTSYLKDVNGDKGMTLKTPDEIQAQGLTEENLRYMTGNGPGAGAVRERLRQQAAEKKGA